MAKRSAIPCLSCRSRQKQIDDLRNRNVVMNARARHFRAQYQHEHALRLAAEQRIRELLTFVPPEDKKEAILTVKTQDGRKRRKLLINKMRGNAQATVRGGSAAGRKSARRK